MRINSFEKDTYQKDSTDILSLDKIKQIIKDTKPIKPTRNAIKERPKAEKKVVEITTIQELRERQIQIDQEEQKNTTLPKRVKIR